MATKAKTRSTAAELDLLETIKTVRDWLKKNTEVCKIPTKKAKGVSGPARTPRQQLTAKLLAHGVSGNARVSGDAQVSGDD